MREITYTGQRIGPEAVVAVTENGHTSPLPLEPSLRIWKHSPTGFEWGYAGSGPAQLALAILLDHTGDKELANRCHQQFKFDVVATLPKDGWKLAGSQVQEWLNHYLESTP